MMVKLNQLIPLNLRSRFRSLHAYVLFWLFVPFTLLLAAALAAVFFIFERNMTRLVLEYHQQMANLATVTINEGIEANARVLEALRDRAALSSSKKDALEIALLQSQDALSSFTAGVVQIDAQGQVLAALPGLPLAQWQALPDPALLDELRAVQQPVYSDVIDIPTGEKAILIAVPTADENGGFSGAIVGGIDINAPANPIHTAIQKLTMSTPSTAFLVDSQGVVISHPEMDKIGQDNSDRPFVGQTLRRQQGSSLWISPEGEKMASAEALVNSSGWRVVVTEPWDVITAAPRRYTLLVVALVVAALVLFLFLSLTATRRITEPVQKLSASTQLLASGERMPDMEPSNILEIENLRAAFVKMARQISSYRDGLRHYVEAITRSQEEERLRIAHELHDDTIQNLLAVYRHMELLNTLETDEHKRKQLSTLHEMIGQTLQGIRLISQDLRPMMLEDLGFVPAMQMLLRQAHRGRGAVPDVRLVVDGEVHTLPPDVELVLYRVVQEALNNVRRHARATSVQVEIKYQPNRVRVVITDDGQGFEVPTSFAELVQSGHLGLMGIQERIWSVNGTLKVESIPEQGTTITITVPL